MGMGVLVWVLVVLSACMGLCLLVYTAMYPRTGYGLIGMLPFAFIAMLLLCERALSNIPENAGLTVLVAFQWIRLCLCPFVAVLVGNYYESIPLHDRYSTTRAVLLMTYEAIVIGCVLRGPIRSRMVVHAGLDDRNANRRMLWIMSALLAVAVVLNFFAPEILQGYRPITEAGEEDFTQVEQSWIVDAALEADSSFLHKFCLVSANYMFTWLRLLLPACAIVLLHRSKLVGRRMLIWAVVLSPLIFVDGAIARSLYFVLLLFIMYVGLRGWSVRRWVSYALVLALLSVVLYWVLRWRTGSGNGTTFAIQHIMNYFCGYNIVAATFNLPQDWPTRLHFLLNDALRCVPFANTIFGLRGSDNIQTFFNMRAGTPGGLIPTATGLGCYYLGPLLGVLFAAAFARLSFVFGQRAVGEQNPFWNLFYLYFSFIMAMGIGMYNISISMTTIVVAVCPIGLVCLLAYPRRAI